MAYANMTMNGCRIYLGHLDVNVAQKTAQEFQRLLSGTAKRASVPNISDMYNSHFKMCEDIKMGKFITHKGEPK